MCNMHCPRLMKLGIRAVEFKFGNPKDTLNCRFVESTANASATHLVAAACQVRAPTVPQRQQQQGQVHATPPALR